MISNQLKAILFFCTKAQLSNESAENMDLDSHQSRKDTENSLETQESPAQKMISQLQ